MFNNKCDIKWIKVKCYTTRRIKMIASLPPHPQIFPSERKYYTADSLTTHMLTGDVDDTSHKGHPSCYFCKVNYLDFDELAKHLRKDHYYCHFCEADDIHNLVFRFNAICKCGLFISPVSWLISRFGNSLRKIDLVSFRSCIRTKVVFKLELYLY